MKLNFVVTLLCVAFAWLVGKMSADFRYGQLMGAFDRMTHNFHSHLEHHIALLREVSKDFKTHKYRSQVGSSITQAREILEELDEIVDVFDGTDDGAGTTSEEEGGEQQQTAV